MYNISKPKTRYFAVIDTETTWKNSVMSIGLVIADAITYKPIAKKYCIISPEYKDGGMYSYVLMYKTVKLDLKDTREKVINYLNQILQKYEIKLIFAYNASFDFNHLPEFQEYAWFDIMKLAAYKQHNPRIPSNADCCQTGRLKHNYGVEPIMKLLSGNPQYHEIHNAVCDAIDELKIMELLGISVDQYQMARVIPKRPSQKQINDETAIKSLPPNPKCLQEIEPPLKLYEEGAIVKHKMYGIGSIIKKISIANTEFQITVKYVNNTVMNHCLPVEDLDFIYVV